MPTTFRGRVENRAELAMTFGVSVVTIDAWVRSGCPAVERPASKGQQWQFNTAAVSAWLQRRAAEAALGDVEQTGADEAKTRKLAAEAGLAELALAQKRGELAPIAEMAAAVSRDYGVVRERLLAIPGKLAGDLDVEQGERVTAEIHEALQELTDDDADRLGADHGGLEGGPDDPEAAVPARPGRMGRAVPIRRAEDQRGAGPVADKRPASRIRPHARGDRA